MGKLDQRRDNLVRLPAASRAAFRCSAISQYLYRRSRFLHIKLKFRWTVSDPAGSQLPTLGASVCV